MIHTTVIYYQWEWENDRLQYLLVLYILMDYLGLTVVAITYFLQECIDDSEWGMTLENDWFIQFADEIAYCSIAS